VRARSPRRLQYWPLGLVIALALALPALAIVVLLAVGVLAATFASLGLTPLEALMVVTLSFATAAFNLPLKRLPGKPIPELRVVRAFGATYLVPALRTDDTVIALNAGGGLLPTVLSGYVWWRTALGLLPLASIAAVGLVAYLLARPVPGLGIALPALSPALVSAGMGILLRPYSAGALAYIGGSLGTLIGADLLNLPRVRDLGAPVASIGGAGTFDGIFVTGLLAVLLAALVR
jgi:uncharacterized membrane protein